MGLDVFIQKIWDEYKNNNVDIVIKNIDIQHS